ncbi:helix-turn-helix domain-containing protein [Sinorhizobium meliloti]|uniref:IclR family transcriptional regulator n=1 Tax=Rhizobium meliloti TaxID=382 RepID=UPI000B49DD63|nr:IclR family transcriptional regulator [Sinorhizobium meliloti]MDW9372157.1 helix-turn-helix domain-containing protein [Sinorhizobium meliloti]MDW9401059.1 helix-turn-helix domain-containing protein [Sinorhizobium meliloti]MDW9540474.1 helix-turn-helix domain-containing protein [Sinorhizobium meliloti]MDW9615459.1 helix-turn-helix domain-containing protein [Sinorhizobium meliloti]
MSSARRVAVEDTVIGKSVDSVPALRRAVSILDLVTNSSEAMSAADITRAMSLPKSTAHGLLGVMTELRLLVRNQDGTFRLGPRPMRWANGFLSEMDIVSIFRDYFASDTTLTSYTVTLTVLDGDEVVYIGCRNSDQPLGHTFRIGMRLPAPFTATGKILLSELPEDKLEALFSSSFPPPISSRSVKNLTLLRQELADIRTRGFSVDDGQIREGMICIGTAVRDYTGSAVAGIAISLLESETTPAIIESLGEKIRRSAAILSEQLGHNSSFACSVTKDSVAFGDGGNSSPT